MADEKDPLEEVDTKGEVQAKIKELEKYSKMVDELDARQTEIAVRRRDQLKMIAEGLDNVIKKNNDRLKQLKKEKDAESDHARAEALDKEIKKLEKKIKVQKDAHKQGIAHQAKIQAALKATAEIERRHFAEANKRNEARLQGAKTIESVSEKIRKNNEDRAKGANIRIMDAGRTVSESIVAAGEATKTQLKAIFSDTSKFAPLLFFGVAPQLDLIAHKAKKTAQEMDTSFRDVIKNTGFNSQKLRKTFRYMMDPLEAKRTDPLFRNLDKESEALVGIGLKASDTSAAMQALTDNVALFRPNFIENNKVASTFTGNLIAGLKKMGVPLAASTKTLNLLTKGMKFTPMQAAKSLKSLVSVADSLGVSTNKVFTNFQSVGPNLAMFGDRTVEVFAELQAKAQATGIEMGKLAGYAEKLDTFKGAATAAQQLNAVLGSTVLSVTDLVHADPAEKFALIQEAVAAAGVDFETADRRMKQVIASAAGMKVDDFAKLVMNQEESEEASKALDTTAMSQEELKKKLEDTMTTAEAMQRNLSSLGGGFDKFLERTRGGAFEAGELIMQTFTDVLEVTESSEAAAIGMVTQLEAINKIKEGNFRDKIKNVTKAALGVVAANKVLDFMDKGDKPSAAPIVAPTAPRTGVPVTPGGTIPPTAAPAATKEEIRELIETSKVDSPQAVEIKLVLADGKEIATAAYADIKKLFGKDTTIAIG